MWIRAYSTQEPTWVNLDQAKYIRVTSKGGLGEPRKYVVYAEYGRNRVIELHRLSTLEAAVEWVGQGIGKVD